MHLIEHHHAVAQPPQTHEVMLDVERGEQRLIHGADAIGRQQRAAALREPGGRGHTIAGRAIDAAQRHDLFDAAQSHDLFVEHRAAMHQLHIHCGIAGKAAQEGQGAAEQRITGGLGRQGDIEAAMLVGRLQTQMGEKGQFGLALAHGRFDQQQGRPLHACEQTVGLALQRPGAEFGTLNDAPDQLIRACRIVQQRPVARPTDGGQCPIGPNPGIGMMLGQQIMALAQGKPLGVGADPVGHAGQPSQPLHRRQGQGLELRHALRRQLGPIGREDFPPRLAPGRRLEGRFGAIEFVLAEVVTVMGADGLQRMAYP
ncbi:hypothetical protein D3C85_1097780 [compost metagenome]